MPANNKGSGHTRIAALLGLAILAPGLTACTAVYSDGQAAYHLDRPGLGVLGPPAEGALVGATLGGIFGALGGRFGLGALTGAGAGALGGYIYQRDFAERSGQRRPPARNL